MKTKFFLIACCCILFFSCQRSNRFIGSSEVTQDSTLIDVANIKERIIHVGEKINNRPLASQVVNIKGKDKYVLADLDNLYIFDWESGELEDSVSTKACGPINNFSGFNFISKDNIIVFGNREKKIFCIDQDGNVKKEWTIPAKSNDETWVSQPIGLNVTRPQLSKDNIFVFGSAFGPLSKISDDQVLFAEYVNTENGEWTSAAAYPNIYHEYCWGANYLNSVSVAKDMKKDCFVVSFPITEQILRYNKDFSQCDTLYMRSRYDEGIEPCDINVEDLFKYPEKEIEFYVGQSSYSDILYDPYRKLYIRMARHKLIGWEPGQVFVKPFSFIVADTEGNLLSESSIIQPEDLYTPNMHVCKEGIAIAKLNSDEDNIYFNVYPINK